MRVTPPRTHPFRTIVPILVPEPSFLVRKAQCTYRCVVLPDCEILSTLLGVEVSQCTYRCVVLPDIIVASLILAVMAGLNAPTGAWCSLTFHRHL